MKELLHTILSVASVASLMMAVSCQKNGGTDTGSSMEGYFFKQSFSYNLTSDPAIEVPVVRLGTSGDLTVSITAAGADIFTVPSSVIIKDGDRVGQLVISYNKADVAFNQDYVIDLTVQNFTSVYGYETATIVIQMPTSYYKYGAGTIVEDWWGEQEDKDMYARDFATNVLQCYLPQCWGHDSGGPDLYPVQDYVWYWDTSTNKVYVPFQYMGCEDWMIADRGAVACMFGGPDYKEGSADWRAYIDKWYTDNGFTQPYYDSDKKAFYLSDTAALSPSTGAVVYGSAGRFDVFTLE